jgi:uncharacterized RDD family membrane protein YckC
VTKTPPAGFWRRAVGALVDLVVILLVKASLGVIAARVFRADLGATQGALVACTLLFAALYVIGLHALEGQTVGKLVVGARVVGPDGAPPAVGVSVLRFVGYFVSLLPFGLGFAMAGLRTDRRALHDLLAGTRVERLTRPATPSQQEIAWTSS